MARSPDFCALDQGKPPFQTLENKDGLTVAELLKIDATKLDAKPWILGADKGTARKNSKALLNFRPQTISTTPPWAEGVSLSIKGFVGVIPLKDGKVIHLEGEGVHACVSDAAGHFWYFRMTPMDAVKRKGN